MNQCDRIKLILQENNLKQKQFAAELGVSESYISMLLKKSDINLSKSLASLIEEKYGYHADWVLSGAEPMRKQVGGTAALSALHQQAIAKLERLNDGQVKAVLAFIRALDEVESCFPGAAETEAQR